MSTTNTAPMHQVGKESQLPTLKKLFNKPEGTTMTRRPKTKHVTHSQIKQIVDHYKQGLERKEIAQRLNLKYNQVVHALSKLGHSARRYSPKAQVKAVAPITKVFNNNVEATASTNNLNKTQKEYYDYKIKVLEAEITYLKNALGI